jgi:tetratricopeptide (TPR) repeat protein
MVEMQTPSLRREQTKEAIVAGIMAAAKAKDWLKAGSLADDAISRGFEDAQLLHIRSIGRESIGQTMPALADLERALLLDPTSVSIANALAACLVRLNEHARAIDVLQAATRRRPNAVEIYVNLGAIQMTSGDPAGARASFEQALELRPDHAQALGKLAVLASHRRDRPAMRDLAQRALTLNPGSANALRTLVELDLDDDRFGDAEARALAWIANPDITAQAAEQAYGLYGDALDGLCRYADAYVAYAKSNTVFRSLNASAFQPLLTRPVSKIISELDDNFALTSASDWGGARTLVDDGGGARAHVFLIGFMRSGTTLLEQALSRHPDVAVLEETEAFAAAGADLLQRPGGLGRLAGLQAGEGDRYRAAYWAAVRQAGVDPADKVFIDKHPFNGIKLSLIAKLFPKAKIVFALRDPRDVVLSCFRQRLRPNAFSYELSNLTGAATLYDRYMHLVESYRGKLALSIHDHRHEALVTDFAATLGATCDHIGLTWTPELTDFAYGALRGNVVSQSSRQLAAGLNAKGVGRWRHYAAEMAPVLPVLAPWVKLYGYVAE